MSVGLKDIQAAAKVIEGHVVRTPFMHSRTLSEITGAQVWLKFENHQFTASFKERGALNKLTSLTAAERGAGVIACSAGNHAQGVAYHAHRLGIPATIVMPRATPFVKVEQTQRHGAEVILEGDGFDQAKAWAIESGAKRGLTLVHPYDDEKIVAGQGTCGLEIIEQCPEVRTILVPTGGGGLTAGIATAAKALRPDVHVVGVQAEGAAAFLQSLEEGRPVPLPSMSTMADGIAVGCPGEVPFEAIRKNVDEIITVNEESLSRALLMLLERAKLVVEPAGAAAVAAMLDHPHRFRTPAVAVLSGGNVDPLLLMKVIRHGLAAAGRYLNFTARIPDLPGGLARLLGELAEVEANVLDVVHERTSATLHLDEVEVVLQVETRGPDHAERVLGRLRECGYTVSE